MRKTALTVFLFAGIAHALGLVSRPGPALPPFGKDTVLVWNIVNQDENGNFVVRIAEFWPNRYFEWENSTTQGTVYLPNKTISTARNFVSARFFEAGVDIKGKDATTLWLSHGIFRDLKSRNRAKLAIDSIEGWMEVIGRDNLSVDVNKVRAELPVIKVKDDRGQERWFLDNEENPLMARHLFRAYSQTLQSITTDRANTLRWIKGKKLSTPR